MASSTNANFLSQPGVVINEHDRSNYEQTPALRSPVCLIFGFSPIGSTMEPRYFNSIAKMNREYGTPENSLEKYFLNAGARVIESGGTALMTRLPYDNFQNNGVKYVRYSIGNPIHRFFIYQNEETVEQYKNYDPDGVAALDELYALDDTIKGYSRIELASETVEHMTVQKFQEVCMDASSLEQDSIYIFDTKKLQLGTNPLMQNKGIEYLGTVPVLVTASTALYVQEKIANNTENDKIFNLISIPAELDDEGNVTRFDPKGLVLDCPWKDESQEDETQIQSVLIEVVESFSQVLDFHHTGTFYDKKSLGDEAAINFPLVRYKDSKRLERKYFDQLGIMVFEMVFNEETEKVDFILRESFCGYISNIDSKHPALEIQVNNNSKYIHIIRRVRKSSYRDYFHITNQPLVVFGMRDVEVQKKLHYYKSIMEPIQHMLDAEYADVDSCIIDVMVDAGITTAAHFAWKKYLDTTTLNEDGTQRYGPDNSFFFNISQEDVQPTLAEVECCSTAWNRLAKMFTKFIETRRGECIYLADGPRCLNLSRDAPLSYHFPNTTNMELFNRYLKYFSEVSSSYGARYFNWVLSTDEYTGLNIWMPPSIIAAQLMCESERTTNAWYAPSGFNRGIADTSYQVSLRTKPYTDENDVLYLNHWNYFTQNIATGIVLEGNKTMQLEHTALDRVNVRRLCNYIKRQVRNISNRYKYEGNTEMVRMNYREDLVSLLTYIQRNAGISDFAVICNNSNNPVEVIERNELRCQIWIKPVKAIEYIIVDLNVTSQTVQFAESFTASRL